MDYYNKHYIRLDEHNLVVKGFSDAFELALDTDICIAEQGGRHFELAGIINPSLMDINGCHLYKYDTDKIITRTTDEILTELQSIVIPKSETLEDKVNNLTIALANLMGV